MQISADALQKQSRKREAYDAINSDRRVRRHVCHFYQRTQHHSFLTFLSNFFVVYFKRWFRSCSSGKRAWECSTRHPVETFKSAIQKATRKKNKKKKIKKVGGTGTEARQHLTRFFEMFFSDSNAGIVWNRITNHYTVRRVVVWCLFIWANSIVTCWSAAGRPACPREL